MSSSVSTERAAMASRSPGPALVFAMALSCGLAVANIYYNQPMLAVMAQDFPGQSAIPLIAMLTQLGYAAGLLLLVPLGDVIERRWLILGQFVLIALASTMAAMATGVTMLMLASVLLGIGATAAQQIVPVAATLADPARRGAVVGSVMSGLLAGILLSRTVAGLVTAWGGAHSHMAIRCAEFDLPRGRALAGLVPFGQLGEQPAFGAFGLGDVRAQHLRPRPAQAFERLHRAPRPFALGPGRVVGQRLRGTLQRDRQYLIDPAHRHDLEVVLGIFRNVLQVCFQSGHNGHAFDLDSDQRATLHLADDFARRELYGLAPKMDNEEHQMLLNLIMCQYDGSALR